MRIVHICPADKFTPLFIEFIQRRFDNSEHQFWIYGDLNLYGITAGVNILPLTGSMKNRLKLLWSLLKCNKVMLHSFHGIRLALLMLLNPWSLKKSYWYIWGGDLYQYQISTRNLKWHVTEFLRKVVISRMAGIVTYIRGDYLNACERYSFRGRWFECLMYTSNVFSPVTDENDKYKPGEPLIIMVGNSATPTNNHSAAFDILYACRNENIKIVCPLSYGIPDYAQTVEAAGRAMFGEHFSAITDYMPLQKYLELLNQVDIAIFSHTRQQAMGNTIALLGSGKTVFLNQNTTQWDFFRDKGIHVGDLQSFSLCLFSESQKEDNRKKISSYFSEENLARQLSELFNA